MFARRREGKRRRDQIGNFWEVERVLRGKLRRHKNDLAIQISPVTSRSGNTARSPASEKPDCGKPSVVRRAECRCWIACAAPTGRLVAESSGCIHRQSVLSRFEKKYSRSP